MQFLYYQPNSFLDLVDKRSVGSVTSQLQDDAACLHAFSGEPVRSFIIAVSSLITGLTLSFIVSVF